jgi:hypothetical protein
MRKEHRWFAPRKTVCKIPIATEERMTASADLAVELAINRWRQRKGKTREEIFFF